MNENRIRTHPWRRCCVTVSARLSLPPPPPKFPSTSRPLPLTCAPSESSLSAWRRVRSKLANWKQRAYSGGRFSWGSHEEPRNEARPRYFWNRTRAGTSFGVSISSGNSSSSRASGGGDGPGQIFSTDGQNRVCRLTYAEKAVTR